MEVLLVISILAILAAILIPVLSHARESSKRAVCAQNLHNVGIALSAYASNWRLRLPGPFFIDPASTADDDFSALYPDYTDDYMVFRCPASSHVITGPADLTHSAVGPGSKGVSFEYQNKVDLKWGMTPLSNEGPPVVAHDTDNNEDPEQVDGYDNHWKLNGGNCLYPDGSVDFIKKKDWRKTVYGY